jgi:hypothetical protein
MLIIAVGAFSIMPVLWYRHIPLADYPNHLGRLQIHKSLSLGDPYLSKFFEFHWTFIPNMGIDLLTLSFIHYMPVEIAGRIAIVFALLMIYGGTILLDRELNPGNWGLSLFSGIFLYCGAFRYGFINYFIGIGFAICGFWIWVRYREKADGIWIVVFTSFGALILVMHLFAFGIYGLCIAGYECSLLWARFRVEGRLRGSLFRIPISGATSLVIPLLFLLWLSPISGGPAKNLWVFIPFSASLARKAEGLAAPIFYSNIVFEMALLIIIFILFAWALATKAILANSRMMMPLGVFGVIFIVMPFELLGSDFADYRLPSAVAFIALASFGWGKTSPTRRNILLLLLSACLIARVGSILSDWQPAQAMIEEYESALQLVPPGSRLLVYMVPTPFGDRNPPLRHVPVLAAAMHRVFDPDTFANGGQLKWVPAAEFECRISQLLGR